MNKQFVLDRLIQFADLHAEEEFANQYDERTLSDHLHELSNRKDETPPPEHQLAAMAAPHLLKLLAAHYKNRVSEITLGMNWFYPDKYTYYRKCDLEAELFDGLEFLSEVYPGFHFDFSSIGGNNWLDKYTHFNKTMLQAAKEFWPDVKSDAYMDVSRKLSLRMTHFLYRGVASLMMEENDYQRYWVTMSGENDFVTVDSERYVGWSARKKMRNGDLAFMYCTAPRKAITAVYRLTDDPIADPWGAWKGLWVTMEKICDIDSPIGFSTMLSDPSLAEWGPIRRHFQGTIVDVVPHAIYNRLIEYIPQRIRSRHSLRQEPVAETAARMMVVDEADFDGKVIRPLLERWDLKHHYQWPCKFHYGTQCSTTRVDFLVGDRDNPLTVFENKFRILNDRQLKSAVLQAKSYALQLGTRSFVVASPEAMWIYRLNRAAEELVAKVSWDDLERDDAAVRKMLLEVSA